MGRGAAFRLSDYYDLIGGTSTGSNIAAGLSLPLTNTPKAKYLRPREGSTSVPNRDYPLWSVVRASTAAPTYFEPETIVVKAADV
jgi:patatin-like phospholipase/acyl hydrolase